MIYEKMRVHYVITHIAHITQLVNIIKKCILTKRKYIFYLA